MSKVLVTESHLEDIADAIREKTGSTDTYTPAEMAEAISDISGGGVPSLQTKNVTYTPTTTAITDTVTADSGYDGLDEVDVTVSAVPVAEYVGQATVPNATHEITVHNDGTISSFYEGGGNVPVIVQSGYALSSDEVFVYANSSEITQMQTQVAQTIYPSSSDQSISSGKYLTGVQTIKAVTTTNLTADNIKSGVTVQVGDSADSDRVLSVTGTYSGGSSASVGTKTLTNSSATNTSISFTGLSGTPKAFFVRCTSQLTRSSSSSYYYVVSMRYNGTNTTGNYWRMSNGTFYNDTTHYSYTYSSGTLTVSSSASRTSAGGSFYNGGYELVYVY